MTIIKSYAAKEAGGELELYEYDAGEPNRKMSRYGSTTAGSAIPICR